MSRGELAIKPPAKCKSSDSTPPSCKLPVLAMLTGLFTDTFPSNLKSNPADWTVNVGVVKPPLKAMPKRVSDNTTLWPVVTAASKLLDSLFITCNTCNGTHPPISSSTLMAALAPPFKYKLCGLPALALSTVFSKRSWPAARKVTSV